VKRFVFILAVLGFGLVLLQKQSYADKKEPHAEYAKMEIKECNSCHKGEGISPNHDSDFIRDHRVLAGKAGNNCGQCHKQSFCLDCHQGGLLEGTSLEKENFGRDSHPKSHRSDFISLHPLKALDNPQQCNRCHDQKYCTSCHSRFPKGSMKIKSHLRVGDSQTWTWKSDHSLEARRNLQTCQTCHPEGDVCLSCHSAKALGGKVNPHPRNFKGSNYRSRSDKTCRACH
jgi:hypothetical protein